MPTLAPEAEADGTCQVCEVRPGSLVLDPFALDDPMVPMVMCSPCYQEGFGEL
jgi:hypothetical protein